MGGRRDAKSNAGVEGTNRKGLVGMRLNLFSLRVVKRFSAIFLEFEPFSSDEAATLPAEPGRGLASLRLQPRCSTGFRLSALYTPLLYTPSKYFFFLYIVYLYYFILFAEQ